MSKNNGHPNNRRVELSDALPEHRAGHALVDEQGNVVNADKLEAQLKMGFVVDTLQRMDATGVPCLLVVGVPTPQPDGTYPMRLRGEINNTGVACLPSMLAAASEYIANLRAATAETVPAEAEGGNDG